MYIDRWIYFVTFRLIPLGFGGMILFGSIGDCINKPIGTHIGMAIGFTFGAWLAWKNMPREEEEIL